MFIHWFPGHMTKAIRMMKEEMNLVQCVVYVLDARAPLSSINSAFDEIIGERPRLYVMNKSDLVPREEAEKWRRFFEKNGCRCITANSTSNVGKQKFISVLTELNSGILEKYRLKGVKKTIRAMVIGVPNCGKSTLINSVIGKSRTITGNKPGVTRGKQWVNIAPYIDLLDTPGTLYPDFSDQKKAVNLAIIGSIKEDVLDLTELCGEIIRFMSDYDAEALKKRYNLEELSSDMNKNIENIAVKRGFLLKGGDIDVDRAAKMVITDFRKQAFGKVILEKYDETVR